MIAYMYIWVQKQFSKIHHFLAKLPGFSNPEKHSLSFLNLSQFCGALNDNIYKLVLIFYLIDLNGEQNANVILSTAGAIFVLPFLLFSSASGILADRLSKSRLIITIKGTEILIMLLAVAAFAFKFSWSSYVILFLLSTQSALFGPSKYGIIPEIVQKDKISKANGLVTSFTYFAILSGTFLASGLTKITDRNYVLVGFFCVFVSIIGFITSFGIKYTAPKGSRKKVDYIFLREIFHTLRECKDKKHLLISIFGASYFMFVGGFAQLNIIPFAMSSLGLTDVAGGFLFMVTALGIAFGSVVAGRASKSQIELGLSCIACVFISIFFFILAYATGSLTITIIALFCIGFFGGNFVVPLETFIQIFSPENNRAHAIAAANFLSFVGVLLASLCIYFFNEVIGLSSAHSFGVMGVITVVFSAFLIIRISDLFMSYTAQKILFRFIPVRAVNIELMKKTKNPILMLEEGSRLKGWLLSGIIPNLHLLVPQYKVRRFPWFQRFFYSLHRIDAPDKFEHLIERSKKFQDPEMIPCVYLHKKKPVPDRQSSSIVSLFTRKEYEVILVNFEKNPGDKITKIRFSKG